jgi:hypothetical protein
MDRIEDLILSSILSILPSCYFFMVKTFVKLYQQLIVESSLS